MRRRGRTDLLLEPPLETEMQASPAMTWQLARRAERLEPSVIREILKITEKPGIISLAGGLPAPQSFPVQALRDAFDRVLRDEGRPSLQYSTTEGDPLLRAWIAARETARGVPTDADEVLITAGSQQAIDLVAKAFVDAEAPVLIESPTYLATLQAFALFDARCAAHRFVDFSDDFSTWVIFFGPRTTT
jgi:2-aminoadipate transaminase